MDDLPQWSLRTVVATCRPHVDICIHLHCPCRCEDHEDALERFLQETKAVAFPSIVLPSSWNPAGSHWFLRSWMEAWHRVLPWFVKDQVQELVQWRNCGTCSATFLWSLVFLISVASSFLVCIQTLYSGQVRVCVALSNSIQALITL